MKIKSLSKNDLIHDFLCIYMSFLSIFFSLYVIECHIRMVDTCASMHERFMKLKSVSKNDLIYDFPCIYMLFLSVVLSFRCDWVSYWYGWHLVIYAWMIYEDQVSFKKWSLTWLSLYLHVISINFLEFRCDWVSYWHGWHLVIYAWIIYEDQVSFKNDLIRDFTFINMSFLTIFLSFRCDWVSYRHGWHLVIYAWIIYEDQVSFIKWSHTWLSVY